MTEKAECKKHGQVFVWVVCRHVGDGSADTVVFSEGKDALCYECNGNIKDLTQQDVVGMCEECLKDFTAKLMIDAQNFAGLKSRIKGLEHLKGKRKISEERDEPAQK